MGRQHWPQGCLDYGCYDLIIKFCKYNRWGTCKFKQNSKSKYLLNVCVLVAMRRLNLKSYCRYDFDMFPFPGKPYQACFECINQTMRSCGDSNWMKRHVDIDDWSFSACYRNSECVMAHPIVVIAFFVRLIVERDVWLWINNSKVDRRRCWYTSYLCNEMFKEC